MTSGLGELSEPKRILKIYSTVLHQAYVLFVPLSTRTHQLSHQTPFGKLFQVATIFEPMLVNEMML